jgi:hypothetical protein
MTDDLSVFSDWASGIWLKRRDKSTATYFQGDRDDVSTGVRTFDGWSIRVCNYRFSNQGTGTMMKEKSQVPW